MHVGAFLAHFIHIIKHSGELGFLLVTSEFQAIVGLNLLLYNLLPVNKDPGTSTKKFRVNFKEIFMHNPVFCYTLG
jgi:hypothetical protein